MAIQWTEVDQKNERALSSIDLNSDNYQGVRQVFPSSAAKQSITCTIGGTPAGWACFRRNLGCLSGEGKLNSVILNPNTIEFKMVKLFTLAPPSLRMKDRVFDLFMPAFKNIRRMFPSGVTFIEWTLIESVMLAQHCLLCLSRKLILNCLGD